MRAPTAADTPTLCGFLRSILLAPDGSIRMPGVDLAEVKARAVQIAQADPDPRRPNLVLVNDTEEDLERVIATLISGRPLMVIDSKRDETLIEQARLAANGLQINSWSAASHYRGQLITPGPKDLALIVSTSGTTGKGKLWGRSQEGLMRQALYQGSFLPGGENLTFAPLGRFQATAAINAIGLAMVGGANYRSVPATARDEGGLIEYLSEAAPAFIACTPTVFRSLGQGLDGLIPWDLRGVWFMGERVKPSDLVLFRRLTRPGTVLRAHYGSTETGNIAVACLDEVTELEGSTVPSGKVSPMVELQIHSEDGRPLPPGTAGHIVVRSPLMGRPIGHMPTARYLPGENGHSFFYLGDEGYVDSEGTLFVLGRRDGVVKIGGVRVDAVGLEALVAPVPGVKEVAVTTIEGASGGDVLAVALNAEGNHAVDRVRTLVRASKGIERKAAVVDIGPFPVTPAQKIDLALLKNRVAEQLSRAAGANPPVTPAEHLVANCWAEVLGIEVPSRSIPLEELGGDSLSLLSISLLLEKRYGLSVPDQRLDRCRTVADLAAALQPQRRDDQSSPVFSLGGDGDVVVACCAGIGGHAWTFGPLARSVSPEIEMLGVRWTEATPERLAEEITLLAGGRPVVPLGFSGGARTAWIVAGYLLARQQTVPAVVVLDGGTRQSIGRRHFGRALMRLLRPRTAADRYLLSLSYAGRRWQLGKQLEQLSLQVYEVRCPDRPENHWGDTSSSVWHEFSRAVRSFDLDCDHQRLVKSPILPEVTRVVNLACEEVKNC